MARRKWLEPHTSAFMWDNVASSFVTTTATFLNLALLRLATVAAGCPGDPDDDDVCRRSTPYGLKPESVLTLVATLGQLSGAVSVPFFGALSDYSHHRRRVGAGSAWLVAGITLAQACVSQKTWFAVALIEIPQIASYVVHQAAVLSYLPGLYRTDDLGLTDDRAERYRVNSYSAAISFAADVFCYTVIGVILIASGFGIVNVAHSAEIKISILRDFIF